MSSVRNLRRDEGFTLVELLIVVIVLAILAAIVVPQFAASTDDAKLSAMDTTLGGMRSALDLYYQQHGEYPSAKLDGAGGAADSSAAFLSQLTQYTDDEGDVALTKDVTHIYGPYLRKAEIPLEPVTNSSAIEILAVGTLGMTATGGDPGGWKFDNKTGQLIVNDAAYETH
jgi:prepilin-type N-terminal cleavage/methylation domain-containing protein